MILVQLLEHRLGILAFEVHQLPFLQDEPTPLPPARRETHGIAMRSLGCHETLMRWGTHPAPFLGDFFDRNPLYLGSEAAPAVCACPCRVILT